MLRLFCKIGDRELGPFSPDQLKEMASTGHLVPEDLIRRESDEDWIPARHLKTLTFGSPEGRMKPPSSDTDGKGSKQDRAIKSNPPNVPAAEESKTETVARRRLLIAMWSLPILTAIAAVGFVYRDTEDAETNLKPAQLALGDPIVNSIGMKMLLIPPGEFTMGSPDSDENAHDSEKPQHRVKLTKLFYLSVYEVTQQQYEKVMGDRPWQGKLYAKDGPDNPATYVNWNDAVEFCRKLSKKEGVEYRLPTEAEWEYACRAGTTTAYSFGDDASQLGKYAWHYKNAWGIGEKYAHRVGQKLPNPWGLYDMHGNAWEWCQDWYAPYGSEKVVSDPMGTAQDGGRVLRGGSSYLIYAQNVRSAYRLSFLNPVYRYVYFGFRAARTYR